MCVLFCRDSCLDVQNWNVVCKFCEETTNKFIIQETKFNSLSTYSYIKSAGSGGRLNEIKQTLITGSSSCIPQM